MRDVKAGREVQAKPLRCRQTQHCCASGSAFAPWQAAGVRTCQYGKCCASGWCSRPAAASSRASRLPAPAPAQLCLCMSGELVCMQPMALLSSMLTAWSCRNSKFGRQMPGQLHRLPWESTAPSRCSLTAAGPDAGMRVANSCSTGLLAFGSKRQGEVPAGGS